MMEGRVARLVIIDKMDRDRMLLLEKAVGEGPPNNRYFLFKDLRSGQISCYSKPEIKEWFDMYSLRKVD